MQYPQPGTKAEQALHHIRTHPGCSQTQLTRVLATSVVNIRRYLDSLAKRGLITTSRDDNGHWHFHPTEAAE